MSAGFTGQLEEKKKQFHYLVEVQVIISMDINAETKEEADNKLEEEVSWMIGSAGSVKDWNVLDVKEKK